MNLRGKGGLQYALSAKPLAAGGEGEIYSISGKPNLVAKIYLPGKTSAEKERKLVKMVDFPPDRSVLTQIAWPQDVLYNAGRFVGFVMPKMNINEDLNVIYEYGASAKYPHMPWDNRLIIAQNLCVVLNAVHAEGHTCGDFNPKNISVDPNTGHITFLDTDSYHITDGSDTLRCDVGIPEYLPAEIQVKMRGGGTLGTAKLPTFSHDTDNFALAIHIFQLLMNGVHPFACAIIPSQASVTAPQPSDNIIKGEFPFMHNIPGIKIPAYAPPISILPKDLQDLFERAFIDGHYSPNARPTSAEWHRALENLRKELKGCKNVPYHQYHKSLSTCPWCDVNNRFQQSFQPKTTLTQTTITAPSYTPVPNVSPPRSSSSSTTARTQPPYQNKQKSGGFVKLLKVAVVIFALFFGFNFIRDAIQSNGVDIPFGSITESPIEPETFVADTPVTEPLPEPAPTPEPITTASTTALMFDSGTIHSTYNHLAPSAGAEWSVVMAGVTYQDVSVYSSGPGTQNWRRRYSQTVFTLHNLNGQFAQLTGYFGRVDGSGQLDATLRFIADGNTLLTHNLIATDMPFPVILSVDGVRQLRIEVEFPNAPTHHNDPKTVYAFSGFVE